MSQLTLKQSSAWTLVFSWPEQVPFHPAQGPWDVVPIPWQSTALEPAVYDICDICVLYSYNMLSLGSDLGLATERLSAALQISALNLAEAELP